MSSSWELLMIILLSLAVQGFFSMLEMACVSFNKVRLQYYVSQNNRRAIWLNDLLKKPGRLFGTVLICANLALQIGSEASRRFYESLNLNPDLAPLTQVVLVLIFAEMAPLFAGRRYAEHAAMIGVPLLYAISFLLKPIIECFNFLCYIVYRFFGNAEIEHGYLSREELQRIFEEKDQEGFNTIAKKIFCLRNMKARDLMQSLDKVPLIEDKMKISEMRLLLQSQYSPFVPLYQKKHTHITAIVYPRDLLRISKEEEVGDYGRAPWFIMEKDSIISILCQFRLNNQSVAIVLNEAGMAQGILTLDEVIDEIFGFSDDKGSFAFLSGRNDQIIVDRTFSGDTRILEFKKRYSLQFDSKESETLEELVTQLLGHAPAVGETVRIDHLELKVEEAFLLGGAKSIAIKTLY